MPYSDRKQNLGKRVKYFIVLLSPSRYRRSYLYVFKRQYGHMDIGVCLRNQRNNHDNIRIHRYRITTDICSLHYNYL